MMAHYFNASGGYRSPDELPRPIKPRLDSELLSKSPSLKPDDPAAWAQRSEHVEEEESYHPDGTPTPEELEDEDCEHCDCPDCVHHRVCCWCDTEEEIERDSDDRAWEDWLLQL